MRILFMGTPDFAVSSLKKLIESKHEVVGVFTRADTPKGRGMKMMQTPVKELAIEHNIPVFQPKTLKDGESLEVIKDLNPDLIVVVAYGRILPKEILDLPRYGCINVHGSILPKYRGAAPIQWAVLNGDTITGVTIMYMSEGLDEGDIIFIKDTEILKNETSGELFERLKHIGADALIEGIDLIESGKSIRIPQNASEATYAPMLSKDMGNLDFSKPAREVLSYIYGLNPWPSAYSTLNGIKIKIFKAEIVEKSVEKIENGTIYDINGGLYVACGGNTAIFITEIQAINKKRMPVSEYLKGNKVEIGAKLTKE